MRAWIRMMEDLGEQYVGYTETLKKETEIFGLKSLRLARELQSGFVLTVEPGIYIISELIDRWRAEKKFNNFINYDIFRHLPRFWRHPYRG
jgi:Xaa-Pro aminopeptidase